MPTIQLKTDVLNRLQEMHALNESATARAIGVNRSTLQRIKDGAPPSAAFIAGAVLTFQVPMESLFSFIEAASTTAA